MNISCILASYRKTSPLGDESDRPASVTVAFKVPRSGLFAKDIQERVKAWMRDHGWTGQILHVSYVENPLAITDDITHVDFVSPEGAASCVQGNPAPPESMPEPLKNEAPDAEVWIFQKSTLVTKKGMLSDAAKMNDVMVMPRDKSCAWMTPSAMIEMMTKNK